jgi:hypothetical protein
MEEIPFLKMGRHFRLENGDKIIVARNERECHILKKLCDKNDHLFEPADFPGPTVVLQGNSVGGAVEKLLFYTKLAVVKEMSIVHSHRGNDEIVKADFNKKFLQRLK